MVTTIGKDKKVTSSETSGSEIVRTERSFYSAPLPPASEFEKYEKVLAGSANRIIKLAENQNSHRRFIEKVVVIFDVLKSIGGLLSALVIVITGIIAGTYLIINNKSTQGLVALFIPLATVVGAFLYDKSKKDIKDSDKD